MSTVDAIPDTMTPDWHEDTIYCEATCEPDDVYYEGSDDGDYDDPAIRKRRYEAAGQRYLDGSVPLLLSASLRGPFNKESGWVNPWRSKTRTSKALQPTLASRPLVIHQQNRSRISPAAEEDQLAETQDSLECHLPSPESLKQVPFTEAHPYLEEEELVLVQKWRNNIMPSAAAKDDFWAASPLPRSSKRRRSNESSWLKRIASKRRKTELMEEGSVKTPILQRSRTTGLDVPSSNISNRQPPPNESFHSAPEYLNTSAQKSIQRRKRDADGETNGDDELVSTLGASFSSASARLASPPKRISPRRKPSKVAGYQGKYSDDELSRDRMAAATLSSPVSQKGKLHSASQSQALDVQANLTHIATTKSSRHEETLSSSSPLSEARSSISSLSDAPLIDPLEETSSEEESHVLETQEDQSFCFKVLKSKTGDLGEHMAEVGSAPMSRENDDMSDTTSSLSSLDDMDEIQTMDDHVSQRSVEETREAVDEPKRSAPPEIVASDCGSTTFIPPTQDSEVIPDSAKVVDSKCEGSLESSLDESHVSMVQDVEEADQRVAQTEAVEEAHQPSSPDDDQRPVDAIGAENSSGSILSADSPSGDKTICTQSSGMLACATPSDIRQPIRRGSTTGNLDDSPVETPSASQDRRFSQFSLKSILNRYVSPLRMLSGLGVHSSPSSQQDTTMKKVADVDAADSTFHSQGVMDLDQQRSQCGSDETSTCSDAESLIADADEGNECATSSHDTGSSREPGSTTAEAVSPGAMAVPDKSTMQETPQKAPPSSSQQSPWAGSQMPRQVNLMDQALSGEEAACNTPEKVGDLVPSIPVDAQSPWVRDTENHLMRQNQTPLSFNKVDNISSWGSRENTAQPCPVEAVDNASQHSTHSGPARSSTPEPQFAFASFASFMTPSPERRSRRTNHSAWRTSDFGLPSTQSILASAMKNPWRSSINRRVSWAPLPNGQENVSDSPRLNTTPSFKRERERPGSPPPMTSLSELPASEDLRFRNHFTAIANRTDGTRHRILPTSSQQTLYRPEPLAMAEKFLAADDIGKPETTDVMQVDEQRENDLAQPEGEDTQDPMDIVEEMFNDMGDFLQTWDVDAELDEARRADQLQQGSTTARTGVNAQQSPW